MNTETYRTHPCDLCGADDAAEIEEARRYTGGQPIHVCRNCGFVYVRDRRSARDIADAWSNQIYAAAYTARIPAVKARQVYVAETIDVELGLRGMRLCDIGGGEGQFLEIARAPEYGAEVFAVEPSAANCKTLAGLGIDFFEGTVEEFAATAAGRGAFDIVTIMWTLEACHDCRAMVAAAHDALKDGGHLVVATGSRILVPFKKPLQYYLSKNPADTHPFRFSVNTLGGLMATEGFEVSYVNRHIDSDVLVMIGRKAGKGSEFTWQKDDYRAVLDFFRRWHAENEAHYVDS